VEVRYLTPAREEFLAALDFYEREAPGLGADFDAELSELEQRIQSHPHSGAPYRHGTRRAILQSFPFAVIYDISQNEIVIVALAHQRRHPDYWADRMR
jgi:plasmid stabilization system protein ParE